MMLSHKFLIDKEALRKNFYFEDWEPQRTWFFNNFKGLKRKEIQEKYYSFLEKVHMNIPFFHWFHAYTVKTQINYPFQTELVGQGTTNVITIWHLKDGEMVRSELPPCHQYQLPNIRDDKHHPVIASPFKTKNLEEEVTSRDIKSLMEQANYTNKYLQVIGEKISSPKQPPPLGIHSGLSSSEDASASRPLEKPLFKPFKLSHKAKQTLQKAKLRTESDSSNELLSRINDLLKATIVPDTPQQEVTSKLGKPPNYPLIWSIKKNPKNLISNRTKSPLRRAPS